MTAERIAVIGLAGRFPGAPDVERLWRDLCAGVEAVRDLDEAELLRAGVPRPRELLDDPRFVRRGSELADAERFDPAFFGLAPREAAATDPQQRLLLELAWEAFEDAGHVPPAHAPLNGIGKDATSSAVGVFVGASRSDWARRVLAAPELAALGGFALELATSRDFLATRIAYLLGLTGPALTVQTACSTSLVAVHLACQSLLAGECDLALAGGASIRLPQATGYLAADGGVASPDGRCRAFDARASGTLAGNGGALVLLRPLADALADGDPVHAVVLATAVNNDGRGKVGFTAPSVEGQAAAIEEALALAGVVPDTIGYVEAHGTGTPLGDPIEVAALSEAFRRRGARAGAGTIPIGSIKSNLGHLDAAAGVAGLVKAVLAVREGRVPPSLHVERPSPALGLERTPFRIATELAPWRTDAAPRRAGVSSFGIGGTNAHALVEEPPARPVRAASPDGDGPALALVSARTPAALDRARERLAGRLTGRLGAEPALDVRDAAWTLHAGRAAFAERAFAVGRDAAELARALRDDPPRGRAPARAPAVAFLFPGQGAQRARMAAALIEREPLVRRELERAAALLRAPLGLDLVAALRDGVNLDETRLAQPALFAVEHALARWWLALGVEPAALLGHSLGELVAACLAGVLSLEDALRVVAERGRLMQAQPPGAMLAVALGEGALTGHLPRDVVLGSVNGPALCVASGPAAAVEAVAAELAREGIACRRVATSHAFHSPAMDGALVPFRDVVRGVALRPPTRRFLSNVTGTWIADAQATDPGYWAEQLRATVRLGDGLAELARTDGLVALEVGPGRTLAAPARAQGLVHVASLPDGDDEPREVRTAAGRLWLAGVELDPRALHGAGARRVRLPTYPFERVHCAPGAAPDEPVPGAAHTRPARAPIAPAGDATPLAAVAAAWRAVLGVADVVPDDDFLELGGSSLSAVEVRARLAEALGVDVPLADVLEATRAAELARRLAPLLDGAGRSAGLRPRSPLVRLGRGGGDALVCVHGIDGDVVAFAGLARALEGRLALVGLRARGLAPDGAPQDDVRAMGERAADAVQAEFPAPYRLAGWSFGALVAFEAARVLRARGAEVASLALLDARLPEPGAPLPDERALLPDDRALREGARATLRRLGVFEDAPDAERRTALLVAHARAAAAWRPAPLDVDALLVLAHDERDPPADAAAARWRALVRGALAVEEVDGDHHSMLTRPGVAGVAEALAARTRTVRLSTPTAGSHDRP